MDSKECIICGSNFTDVRRKPIQCLACQQVACKDCVKNYLLNADDIRCMYSECAEKGNRWSRSLIASFLSQNFINKELASHEKNSEFRLESGHIPYTLEIIEQKKKIQDIIDQISEDEARIKKNKEILFRLKRGINLDNDDSDDDDGHNELGAEQRPRKKEIKTKFACPNTLDGEKCRGFVHGRGLCII